LSAELRLHSLGSSQRSPNQLAALSRAVRDVRTAQQKAKAKGGRRQRQRMSGKEGQETEGEIGKEWEGTEGTEGQ